MYLKQQNNLLIDKIWTTENFPQKQVLVPYPFILYWVTKKVITKNSASQILHSYSLFTAHAMWAVKEHETKKCFWLSLCSLLCLSACSVSGWPDEKWKICQLCNHDFIFVNIDNANAEFVGGFNGQDIIILSSNSEVVWFLSPPPPLSEFIFFYTCSIFVPPPFEIMMAI